MSEIFCVLRHVSEYHPKWYYCGHGDRHRDKFLISTTTDKLELATHFATAPDAFTIRANIWGVWEVVAFPHNEIIDPKIL